MPTRDSIRAVVNLALLTGNLGKPGAGVFALSEQNNLQGVCDMGMLPDRLPGYQSVANDEARGALEALWKTTLPAIPGAGSRSVLTHRQEGRVKALWLCRYDPVSTASFADVANSLGEFDFVIAQHLFMTDSARHAHVVLPTTAFGEERVSFTSTERRIQLAEQVVDPPAGLTPAWEQLSHVARLLGADWNYHSASDVMEEIGEAIPLYSGASYDNLYHDYGRQWPCTKDRPLGTRFLFAGNHGDKPFKFVPVSTPPETLNPTKDFPLTLVFGNSLYYWNQNVVIRHSETLKREYQILLTDYPQGFVEIHPDDAKELGIRDGDKVRLYAASASAVSTARVTPEVKRGTVFVPYFERGLEKEILGHTHDGHGLTAVRVEKEAA